MEGRSGAVTGGRDGAGLCFVRFWQNASTTSSGNRATMLTLLPEHGDLVLGIFSLRARRLGASARARSTYSACARRVCT